MNILQLHTIRLTELLDESADLFIQERESQRKFRERKKENELSQQATIDAILQLTT